MKGFRACLYKDTVLLGSGTGLFGILLTVLLALFSVLGMNDMFDKAAAVQPFAIGIIDCDDSPLSKAFITQLRAVPAFSSLRIKKGEEAKLFLCKNGCKDFPCRENTGGAERSGAEELFKKEEFSDCAAIIIIPRDYFYSLYEMRGENCRLILNGTMPLEANLTFGMVSSVSELISEERSSWYSAYMLYTESGKDEFTFYDFCDAASIQMLESVLGRRGVFDKEATKYNDGGETVAAFAACAAGMLILLVCTGVLKTLPEEARSGILNRFMALGGSPYAVMLSKLLAAAAFTVPGIIVIMLILKLDFTLYTAALVFLSLLAGFCLIFMTGMICENARQFMLAGSLITAVSLLMGGVIYPPGLLPEALKPVSTLCIPYHIMTGFRSGGAESLAGLGAAAILTGTPAVFAARKRFFGKRKTADSAYNGQRTADSG